MYVLEVDAGMQKRLEMPLLQPYQLLALDAQRSVCFTHTIYKDAYSSGEK
jgi:hypothetical protein